MTENRFTLHITWFNKEKTEGEALLKDNGQPLLETERIDDVRLLKNILNELYDENSQLKHEIEDFQELLALKEREEFLKPIIQQIEEARERERTNLGKSVIQQLLEQLQ